MRKKNEGTRKKDSRKNKTQTKIAVNNKMDE